MYVLVPMSDRLAVQRTGQKTKRERGTGRKESVEKREVGVSLTGFKIHFLQNIWMNVAMP